MTENCIVRSTPIPSRNTPDVFILVKQTCQFRGPLQLSRCDSPQHGKSPVLSFQVSPLRPQLFCHSTKTSQTIFKSCIFFPNRLHFLNPLHKTVYLLASLSISFVVMFGIRLLSYLVII
uniref:Uncharacterized protein n=1 Tax=Schistocephalus solidus TaxID=70667 RepID=A0A0X3PX09_SCHSO